MVGEIMAISRLRMATDGQGVSTLVTFYGCPLHCKYCINEHCHEKEFSLSRTVRAMYKPEELLEVLRKDEIYYLMTGGGIVFGGGEPLLQSAFIYEICRLANPSWKKRIETSLNVPWEYIEPILYDIDEWIVDIKDINNSIYKKYTGVSNEKLIQNFFRMYDSIAPEKWHIRVPYIEGFNNSKNVEESVKWIREVLRVEPEVFRYHVFS